MKSEHAYAGGQEASPEDGSAVEGGSLLDGEQQAPYGRCKGCCHPYTSERKGCYKSYVKGREGKGRGGGEEGKGGRGGGEEGEGVRRGRGGRGGEGTGKVRERTWEGH